MLVLHAAICTNVFMQEHKKSTSSIGKHFRDKHSLALRDLTKNLRVLKKCTNKFDCLLYEMFFIQELRPALNVLSVSICAKVFNYVINCNFNF